MESNTEARAERVVFMEYNRIGKPVSAFTVTDDTDIDFKYIYEYVICWCKRDRIAYYFCPGSGSGHGSIVVSGEGRSFWAAPEIEVIARDGATRREHQSGFEQQLERALDGDFACSMEESECEYCSECDDYLPTHFDEPGHRLCEHCWWCNETGWYSRPGARCPWDCRECRQEDRERALPPPDMILAQGYGLAAQALSLKRIMRQILRDRDLTPESLADRLGWCRVGILAIQDAMQGDVNKAFIKQNMFNEQRSVRIAVRTLDLNPDEQKDLFGALGYDD